MCHFLHDFVCLLILLHYSAHVHRWPARLTLSVVSSRRLEVRGARAEEFVFDRTGTELGENGQGQRRGVLMCV